MALFLGIDAGGTKTAAVIVDAQGIEQGRGEGGAGNIAVQSDATLRQSLADAIGSACQSAGVDFHTVFFAGVCAGAAGYSILERRMAFQALLQDAATSSAYRVEPDYFVAYWGATEGEVGVVVIAGTGAVSYGRNAQGEEYKEDGLGYLLGDRGSGFNLGLRVLRDSLDKVRDGRSDALTAAVLAFTQAQTQNEILQWLYRGFSPARVASLAPIIGELAEQGDPEARRHLSAMAHHLRHSVRQVRHKLYLPRDTPVYPLGGLWQLGAFFRSEFAQPTYASETGDDAPISRDRFFLATPRHDPAYGAALLAQEEEERGRRGEGEKNPMQ